MGATGLQVSVLGDLTVLEDGRRIDVPGSRKTRALLGYLLLQDRPVTREHLCEVLWPHPDNPRAALRWSLTKLRPILNGADQVLQADRNTVSITRMDDRVDMRRINQLMRKKIEQIPTAELEAAAGLFHGELLEGLEIPDCHRFNAWLIAYQEAARQSHRTILETLTMRLNEQPEAALGYARQRVALDPLDESAHVQVVRLLSELGRGREAQEQAVRCRAILEAELGMAPGPALSEALRAAKPTAQVLPTPEAPTPIIRTADAGLFGRAEQCVHIEEFLSPNRSCPVLFLEGDSGIGKSRLLAELKRRSEGTRLTVLTGRSWEVETVRPFAVWMEMLQELPGDLIPSFAREATSSQTQEHIIAEVKGLIAQLWQAGAPLVLVFDDLQWVDQASAQLMAALSSELAGGTLAMACAGRPGEFADNDLARALLRTWNREGLLQRLVVEPLPDKDAAALVRAVVGSGTDSAVAITEAVAACGGNPLYLIETGRGQGGSGQQGVAALVADRLAVFDEATREVVDWAAVMGRAFPATRLGQLLDRPLEDLLRQTEALERHGILLPHGDGWDFAHDLLRSAALGQMSGPRRALMHRRSAQLLAGQPDLDGALAGEIMRHASRGDLPELAARSAIKAGDRALKLAAMDEAWKLAERGLQEVVRMDEIDSLDIEVELLRIQVLAGLGRRDPLIMVRKLLDVSGRATKAALNSVARTARWLLSVVAEESGDFDQAKDHSLKAEKASRGADPETRLKAVANTARCLLQLERDPDRAEDLLDQARQLSKELEAPVLDIPWAAGLLHLMKGEAGDARAALLQGAEMANEQDNHWAHFECLSRLSMLDLQSGDCQAIHDRDSHLRAVAEKLGEGSELALTDTLLALANHQSGGVDDEELERALVALRKADSKGLLSYALIEAGQLDLGAGNSERAARRAEEAARAADEVGRHHQLKRALNLFERINNLKEK